MTGRDRSADVAVTGMAARFPGPEGLEPWWRSVLEGNVHTTRFDREELLAAGIPDDLVDDPDYVPVHAQLSRWDAFDHEFFRISPREAELMDPQQRLMLEVAWNALEDAATAPGEPALTTGVYASVTGSGYLRAILRNQALEPALLDDLIHGTEPDFMASRIAYKLGLTGPAFAVQTACSSSLVSVHLAVQALLNGDCDQALAVATGFAYPVGGYVHLPGGVLSASGACRPFDQHADGVVGGSGVACVVLRRYADLSDEDPAPHGLILGSAINNDGSAKAGYYAPSAAGQRAVIEAAWQAADVDGASIGFLEAHGTGTRIGDPIEWSAAAQALRSAGAEPGSVALGGLKGNIGHLDAAAGLAALIRALKVVGTGEIPPMAGFSALNPLLDTELCPLYVPRERTAWPRDGVRRAGASAFGIGGTNAHVVVEQPPSAESRPARAVPDPEADQATETERLVLLSAAEPAALSRVAAAVTGHLASYAPELAEACATLSYGRTVLPERLAVAGRTSSEVAKQLADGTGVVRGRRPVTGPAPLAFLFPGQGSQRPGMARRYLDGLPGFERLMNACLDAFEAPLSARLRAALTDVDFPEAELDQTELAQPSIFVVGYSAASALTRLGVRPAAVSGHSLGEIMAACIAGVLDLEDAARFVAARGRAMQACKRGAMLALGCAADQACSLVEGWGLDLDLAAVNGPESNVLAGPVEHIEEFRRRLEGDIFSRVLRTTHAFHSSLMEPSLPALEAAAAAIRLRPTRVAMALGSTGTLVQVGEVLPEHYLRDQARRPVLFGRALAALAANWPGVVTLETGPGRVLAGLAEAADLGAITLDQTQPGADRSVLTGLGALWAAGQPIPAQVLIGAGAGRKTRLPGYPFDGPRSLAPEALAPKDRRAPGTPPDRPPRSQAAAGVVDVDEALFRIWSEVLGRPEVARELDFFTLGGDSLMMTRLIRRVNEEFGVRVPVREMLATRTINAQVDVVRRTLGA